MRVVIDTNVFVSASLSSKAAPARIFENLREGIFELFVTEEILAEYRRALGYEHVRELHGLTIGQIEDLVRELADLSVLVNVPNETAQISGNPDDDKFLQCAYAGGADYIVSGDKHLLTLKQYEGIRVLSPTAFLIMLTQEKE